MGIYKVLTVYKVLTASSFDLEQKLNDAAEKGFRFKAVAVSGGQVVAVLEKEEALEVSVKLKERQ